jgi:hypothetical protein
MLVLYTIVIILVPSSKEYVGSNYLLLVVDVLFFKKNQRPQLGAIHIRPFVGALCRIQEDHCWKIRISLCDLNLKLFDYCWSMHSMVYIKSFSPCGPCVSIIL